MAGHFSDATLQQVRAASDIVDVISAVLPLKRAGANFVALCPFHKERTPSFNVSPQRQIFHCFGCHKGGDVFQFIQEFENITFPEAVRRLAERAKIPLESEASPGQVHAPFLKDKLLDIHEQIAQRWHAALLNDAAGEPARAYLVQRGVSAEAVQLFRLGYAPDAWDDTVNWAKAKGYDSALVEQAGLIIRKEGESRCYDRFRGRLMFPICDEQGRVVAFSGRVLTKDDKTAKYVNSPETPIFTKGRVFFGLDKSKRALLEAQSAIICEGQLDLIACYMGGVQNVVAPQGTAFTADHARILKRYVNEVVLCFDSDTAGHSAVVRVLDSLVASGLAIRVASVPAPHDPDSYIKQFGGKAFAKLIEGAEGFFDYYLKRLCDSNDLSSDRGQWAVVQSMGEALRKAGNSVLQDKYAQKTAFRLGVSPDAIRLEFKKSSRAPARAEPEESTNAPAARPPAHELWLLKILLLNEDLADWTAAHLDLAWIQDPRVRQVLSKRLASQAAGSWAGAAALLSGIDDNATRQLISESLAEARSIPDPQRQLSDLVLRLRNQEIDRELASLVQQANNSSLPEPDRLELVRRLQERRLAKNKPLE